MGVSIIIKLVLKQNLLLKALCFDRNRVYLIFININVTHLDEEQNKKEKQGIFITKIAVNLEIRWVQLQVLR